MRIIYFIIAIQFTILISCGKSNEDVSNELDHTNISQNNNADFKLFENNDLNLKWDNYFNLIKNNNDNEKIAVFHKAKEHFSQTKVLTDIGFNLMRFKIPFRFRNYSTDKYELKDPLFTLTELKKAIHVPELDQAKNEFELKKIEEELLSKYKNIINGLNEVKYLVVSTLPFKMGEYNFTDKMFFRYGNDATYDGQIIEYIRTHDKYDRDFENRDYSLNMTEKEAEVFLSSLTERTVIYHFIVKPEYFKTVTARGVTNTLMEASTIHTIITDHDYNIVYIKN